MENNSTKGYIYIMINPSLRGDMLKIGMTSKASEDRANELSSGTGIPTKYIVAYEEFVPDIIMAEKLIHEKLKIFRVNIQREFFSLPLKHAITEVQQVASHIRDIYEDREVTNLEPGSISSDTTLSGADWELRALAQSGKKIEAIKLVRKTRGLGLKEAKEYVENLSGLSESKGFITNKGCSRFGGGLLVLISAIGLIIGVILLSLSNRISWPRIANGVLGLSIAIIIAGAVALILSVVLLATSKGLSDKPISLTGSITKPDPISASLVGTDYELRALMRQGKKIEAIKLVRQTRNMGLKDAKDYVENL